MVSAESSANMLTCEMCAESISYGDDYVAHLQIVHNIVKNYNFFLQKANEQLKGGQKRKADVITLEEDDDEEMEEETLSKDQEQEDFVLDPKVKEDIETIVEKTMNELLDPIKKLIDGKVPLGEQNLTEEDLKQDPFKADEKIWESFNQLKKAINELEFPEELLLSLTNPQKESGVHQKQKPTKSSSSTQFKLPPAVDQQNKRRATESPSSKVKTSTGKTVPKITPKKANPIPEKTIPVQSPSSNISSPRVSESSTPGKTTTYCCPLEGCTFSTSKEGMKTGDAAQHLKKDHGVTKQKMTNASPGYYKFNKVKSEKKTLEIVTLIGTATLGPV